MRKAIFVLLSLLSVLFFILPCHAEETSLPQTDRMPTEYQDFLEAVPKEIRDLLPSGLFSDKTEEVGEAVAQMSDFSYLLQTVLSLVGLRLEDCAKILATVCGLLMLSALFGTWKTAFRSESVYRAFSFCATLVITVALLSQSGNCLQAVSSYFSKLNTLTAASVPLMGALYAMGGNVSAAVASSSGLSVFMMLLEELVGKSILPFCGLCMAGSLVSSLDPSLRTGSLLGTVKKNYTTALAFFMMLLLAMLAAQTALGTRGDTLAMRSAKFAAGNLIPVVGGSVAELLRTVSAGVGFLRGTVGWCGILLILLTLLPTLIELLLLRFCWQLCASLADLLGCDGEKRLLEEFSSLLGFLIAAVSICSSVLLLAMALFAHCSTAF